MSLFHFKNFNLLFFRHYNILLLCMDHIMFLSHTLLDISNSRLILKSTADILIFNLLLPAVVDT